MVRLLPTHTTDDAPTTARYFDESVFRYFGLPDNIVSDRDPRIISLFWTALCAHLNIKRRLSTSDHPQTDGQSERSIQTLELLLRHITSARHDNWVDFLPRLEFAYNNSVHAVTGVTPFFALLGYHPLSPSNAVTSLPNPHLHPQPTARQRVHSLRLHLRRLHAIDTLVRDAMASSQLTTATRVDATRTNLRYVIGDKVFLSASATRTATARDNPHPSAKLEPRWLGPFPVSAVIGPRTYRLDLPAHMRIHPVIDVARLAPFRPSDPALFPDRIQRPPPPPQIRNGEQEWEVDRVISKRGKGSRLRYLVQWRGRHHSDATWEPLAHLEHARNALRAFDPTIPARGPLRPP